MGKDRRFLKSFVLHFRPRTIREPALQFTYTWGLGGASAMLVLLLMVTGTMLIFTYAPVPDRAYDSIVGLHTTIPFGPFVRNMHHWSANLLVIFVFLHLLRVFFTGAYKDRRKMNWLVGLALFTAILLSNFTGYLLPWDQLAYSAVTICASMLSYIPGIGNGLQNILIGGKELGPATLSNFFALHTAILPAILILLLPFHFWRIRKAGALAVASHLKSDSAAKQERIDVIPHLMVRELAMAASTTALVMLMAALWDAPLAAKANPRLSPNPTKAPWYFAGLQELLLHYDPWLAVAIILPLLMGAMIALPFLPFDLDSAGIWFGTKRGCRTAMAAGLAGMTFTPIWIVGYANGFIFMAWGVPLADLVLVVGGCFIFNAKFGLTIREAIQGVFAYLLATFVVLTITGIWFRGPSMSLVGGL
jgi:quinol-cytochrome oxidoreductase complex cytochrome b subunit